MIRQRKCSECGLEKSIHLEAPSKEEFICFQCLMKMAEEIKKKTRMTEKKCDNCIELGVADSSNVYVMCNECMNWKIPLQEKPNVSPT